MAADQQISFGIIETHQGCACFSRIGGTYFNGSPVQVVGERSGQLCIIEGIWANTAQCYRPMDATKPPLVLILHVRGVAVADHHQDQGILPVTQVVCEVKHRRKPCVLSHADERSVEIHLQIAFRTADSNDRLACFPRFIQYKTGTVHPGGIVLGREWRSIGKGHDHIGVVWFVIPLDAP